MLVKNNKFTKLCNFIFFNFVFFNFVFLNVEYILKISCDLCHLNKVVLFMIYFILRA